MINNSKMDFYLVASSRGFYSRSDQREFIQIHLILSGSTVVFVSDVLKGTDMY